MRGELFEERASGFGTAVFGKPRDGKKGTFFREFHVVAAIGQHLTELCEAFAADEVCVECRSLRASFNIRKGFEEPDFVRPERAGGQQITGGETACHDFRRCPGGSVGDRRARPIRQVSGEDVPENHLPLSKAFLRPLTNGRIRVLLGRG